MLQNRTKNAKKMREKENTSHNFKYTSTNYRITLKRIMKSI